MQVTIRKATVDDAKIISFIGVSSWQAAYRGIIPDSYLDDLSVEQREKHLIQSFKNPNIYFAIAEIESHAVGMICFHPSYHETSEKGAWEIYYNMENNTDKCNCSNNKKSDTGYEVLCLN